MTPQLLRNTLTGLDRHLLECDVPVRLPLLGALAGEHVLLIGPPGTAKSELARRLHRVFARAQYFERLLTRFSVPEELFGPLSLKALEHDRYERSRDGFLLTAQVAFLDEVFKANSAILNALLTLLNEREFDNGSGRVKVPLISVVGATNEVPDDEALHAFYDRFLLRVPVGPVGDASFVSLLALPGDLSRTPQPAAESIAQPPAEPITQPMRAQLQRRANAVALPDAVSALLVQARASCAAQAITVSDRRWRKVVALLKVQAASRTQDAVSPWDLWLLPYALSATPEQGEPMAQWFLQTVALAVPLDVQWLERATQAFEKQLEIELRAPSTDDDGAGKVALARAIAGERANNEEGMLRMVSERAQRRYSQVHIEARCAQVAEALGTATITRQAVRTTAQAALSYARAHLWLPPSWLARIAAVHHANQFLVADLVARLAQLQQAFAAMPLDTTTAADVPEPIALLA
jgi:MoxR-like ATPase